MYEFNGFLIRTVKPVGVSHFQCVSVSAATKSGLPAGAASASNLGGHWWVERVLVQEHHAVRGVGLGSEMLKRLLKSIVEVDEMEGRSTLVQVCPGGYGADPERQFNFYLKNGFKRTKNPDLLEWTKS